MTRHHITAEQLRQFIARIEKLNEEKSDILGCIKDVYGEAKAHGYEPKVMRKIIALRAKSKDERDEEEHLLDVYKLALGMIDADVEA